MTKRLMKTAGRWMAALVLLGGCAEGATGEPSDLAVSEAELDENLQEGKYDLTTNYLVSWVGSLDPDDSVSGKTTSSKRYHGYTVTLAAGQTIKVSATSTKASVVKAYGPATSTGSKPTFKSAIASKTLAKNGSSYAGSLQFTASKAGVYGIVYWPTSTSSSSYTITTSCVSGCSTCKEMFDSCDGGEGFCGCVDSGCSSLTCKPYAQEGDSCGGFTLPNYYQICDPALDCAGPSFVMDLPGVCSYEVTLAELLANPAKYDGHQVSLEGEVSTSGTWCTLMLCPSWNPCCNTCGTTLLFHDSSSSEGLALVEDGETWGCHGDSCDAAQECTGEEGAMFVSGIFDAGSNSLELSWTWSLPSF